MPWTCISIGLVVLMMCSHFCGVTKFINPPSMLFSDITADILTRNSWVIFLFFNLNPNQTVAGISTWIRVCSDNVYWQRFVFLLKQCQSEKKNHALVPKTRRTLEDTHTHTETGKVYKIKKKVHFIKSLNWSWWTLYLLIVCCVNISISHVWPNALLFKWGGGRHLCIAW